MYGASFLLRDAAERFNGFISQLKSQSSTLSVVYGHASSSSSSGTMGPAPVGVNCLSCNEFPSSAILGQTVQLL